MNIESNHSPKEVQKKADDFSLDDFDFKPITSGLGFHHPKIQDVKPIFTEKNISTPVGPMKTLKPQQNLHKEAPVYQNDLSLFYQNQSSQITEDKNLNSVINLEEKSEEVIQLASKAQRVISYFLDLTLLSMSVALVLLIMARIIQLDLLEAWALFPHELTPLSVILFCGFYLIYFSIFEKGKSSTLGKNLIGIRVVDFNNETLSLGALILRTTVSLLNFLTLGLFSWFDLQNKITNSKVIRVK